MHSRAAHPRLDDLVQRYASEQQAGDQTALHWICIAAVIFSILGMFFVINFGLSLIAIAVAIVYYARFGERIAAPLGALLLGMLAIWMMLMPAHHLVASSLCIFLAALTAEFSGQIRAGQAKPLSRYKQYLLAGPVYGLVMFREKLALREKLAETPGFDPN
jgi:hypothetical protein